MIKIQPESQCYSCGACMDACRFHAIQWESTREGFPVAVPNPVKCVNCHQCDKVCIAVKEKNEVPAFHSLESYYGYNADNAVRRLSSSGGLFYPLASCAAESGFYICGCVWDTDWQPKHIITRNAADIKRMLGSKYVLSDMRGVYEKIRQLLRSGERVLFSGVPCQIAALRRYCGELPGLICIAIVCHGVISPGVWQRYVEEVTKEHGEITAITMRGKDRGWLNYGLQFTFADGSVETQYRRTDGYFLQCYTEGLFERQRCLSCQFKGGAIYGDILLGDGWGDNLTTRELDDGLGLSMIFIQTPEGKQLFDQIRPRMTLQPFDEALLLKSNQRIVSSAEKNRRSERFFKNFSGGEAVKTNIAKYAYVNSPEAKAKKYIRRILKGKSAD